VALRLVGFSPHTHTVQARINGVSAGSLTFEGRACVLTGEVPGRALLPRGNRLELDYEADVADRRRSTGWSTSTTSNVGYRPEPVRTAAVFELRPWSPALPRRAPTT